MSKKRSNKNAHELVRRKALRSVSGHTKRGAFFFERDAKARGAKEEDAPGQSVVAAASNRARFFDGTLRDPTRA